MAKAAYDYQTTLAEHQARCDELFVAATADPADPVTLCKLIEAQVDLISFLKGLLIRFEAYSPKTVRRLVNAGAEPKPE